VSITVVAQGYTEHQRDAGLIEAAMRQLERRTAENRIRGAVRLFRNVQNTALLLLMADWDSDPSETAEFYQPSGMSSFDALCVGSVQRSVFRRSAVHEIACRSCMVDCALVLSPTPARRMVQTLSKQVLDPAVTALPGFVWRNHYQDMANPDRWLIVQGWESSEALHHFLCAMAPRLTTSLARFGATVDRFVGEPRG
jgi:hypothetical protein